METIPHFQEIPVTYKPEKTFQNAWDAATRHRLGFAAWRMPGEKEAAWMVGHFETIDPLNITPPVFLRGLFNNMLPAEGLFPQTAHLGHSIFNRSESPINLDELFAENPVLKHQKGQFAESNNNTSKKDYIALCKKALEKIRNNELQKVVPAREKQVELTDSFYPPAFFDELCKNYPDAFVSISFDPREDAPCGGIWINATPELLLEINENKISTMALAGTVRQNSSGFSEKEKEEQTLVEKYISEILENYNENYRIEAAEMQNAGHLSHIRTNYTTDLNGNWGKLLKELHPTPAVCGYPAQKALRFILDNETINRGYYAGFLGPVLEEFHASIFVNLRCMQVKNNLARLYAGAGIVKDSSPEKEWEETEEKINTLLNLL